MTQLVNKPTGLTDRVGLDLDLVDYLSWFTDVTLLVGSSDL